MRTHGLLSKIKPLSSKLEFLIENILLAQHNGQFTIHVGQAGQSYTVSYLGSMH